MKCSAQMIIYLFVCLSGFWTEAQNAESKLTVLCLLFIIILISYIIIYDIIIKLLIMDNHPSGNRKRNSSDDY
jgi:hypothetical protein